MRISMPRGDIKWIRFVIITSSGTTTDIDFTNIYFTVKRKSSDKMYLFQKSLKRGEIYKLNAGDYQLKIDPDDTNKLSVGDYEFDIQISYKNLIKESFVGDFVLKKEITYYENEDDEEEETDFTLPQESAQPTLIVSIPDYHILELETPATISGSDGDYNHLSNIPTINNVPIKGNVSLEDLGISPAGSYASSALTPEELDTILEELESESSVSNDDQNTPQNSNASSDNDSNNNDG